MINEIKKKKTRFGAIIAFYDPEAHSVEDLKALEGYGFAAGFVYLHRVGATDNRGYGLVWVGHKTKPKAKQVLGHYITQFRGDGLVGFISPYFRLYSDAEKLYEYAQNNRMERTYAVHAGDPDSPAFIAVTPGLVEHIFHAVPDGLEMGPAWLEWLHKWLKKSILGGRYFDASVHLNGDIPIPEVIDNESGLAIAFKEIESGKSVDLDVALTEPPKKRRGRPKTKK